MTAHLFYVKLRDKCIVYLITEIGRIYDITGCQPVADNKFGINYNGVLRNAKLVTPEFVADLLADHPDEFKHVQIETYNQQNNSQVQSHAKGKASSKTKRQRKRKQAEKEVYS